MGALDGQVACITGGTRGIGRATAEAFLREGASVVINGRDADKAATAVAEIVSDDGVTEDRVQFMVGDVKRRADCEAVITGPGLIETDILQATGPASAEAMGLGRLRSTARRLRPGVGDQAAEHGGRGCSGRCAPRIGVGSQHHRLYVSRRRWHDAVLIGALE